MLSFFTRHPTAANLSMLAIIALGIFGAGRLERETFPEFDPTLVSVRIAYPGASARDVDEQVCAPLSNALREVEGLEDQNCSSVFGAMTITAQIKDGYDPIRFFNDISSAVASTQDLPDGIELPQVAIRSRSDRIALISVSGLPSEQNLAAYSEHLVRSIEAIDGVAAASVSGLSESQLQIALDPERLRALGVSSRSVATTIASRALQSPIGEVTLSGELLSLRYVDTRRSIAELSDLIVLENGQGGFVRLGDVAQIAYSQAKPEVRTEIDGVRGVLISVEKYAENDALRVFASLEDAIDIERARYPEPFELTLINQTKIISDRLSTVTRNLAQGLALVLLILFLFFSWREALWISLTLPISLLGGLFLMSIFGVSINMISLVALLISIGLIMDDSIVISDNIARCRRHAPDLMQAAIDGTREVIPGVVSSFLTTAAVFCPLIFLEGNVGAILSVIPLVLLMTLGVSVFEAFFILPHHLRSTSISKGREKFAPRLVERFTSGFLVGAIGRLTRWRYATFGATMGLFLVSLGMVAGRHVTFVFFPSVDGDSMELRLALSPGSSLEETSALVGRATSALYEVQESLSPTPLIERVIVRYADNADVRNNGPHTATVFVHLISPDAREVSTRVLLRRWKGAFGPEPDLVLANFATGSFGPGGADIDFEIFGDDVASLASAADALVLGLKQIPGVLGSTHEMSLGARELELRLLPNAFRLGLDARMVIDQMRTAFTGLGVDRFTLDDQTIAIETSLESDLRDFQAFSEFPISLPGGGQVALESVASLSLQQGYPQVSRRNGDLYVRVTGELDRSVLLPSVLERRAEGLLARIKSRWPALTIGRGAGADDRRATQRSTMMAFTLGLLGIYFLLSYQFRSYALPLVVMLAIPFSLIGVIFGHFVLGLSLSMPSLIGFASLSGIVVNNSILFMTFFDKHATRKSYVEASISAARDRFRPILLSSFTTFAGVTPILFETSIQAQVLVPLVASVAFGVLFSTLLVVFVFPSAISIYFDVRNGLGLVYGWLFRSRAKGG